MQALINHLSNYERYHTKMSTKITHFIGVPLAIIPIFILFNWINFGVNGWFHLGISWLALIGLFVYYFLLDKELAIATTIGLIILNIIARLIGGNAPNWLGFKIMIIVFIIAWAIQFLGHFLEGKKPALFDNLFQALIAPIFTTTEIAFLLGKKADLKAKMKKL